ncbi:hypothetical protein ACLOJK_039501 [Asimina triloba]
MFICSSRRKHASTSLEEEWKTNKIQPWGAETSTLSPSSTMTIFSSLKTLLLRNTHKTPRNSLSVSLPFHSSATTSLSIFSSSPPPPLSFSFALNLASSHTRLFSPFYRWIPLSGPLFLSSPPWKLLQSATPLFSNGKVVLRKPESLNLLLARRNFPIRLGFVSGNLIDLERRRGESVGVFIPSEFVGGFVNLPNFISLSRLMDGFVARKMGINSVIGSYLDPLADKVLIGCVALAMVKKDLLHPGLVGLVVLRDAALISGVVYKRAHSLGWEWKSWYDFVNLDGTRPERVEPIFLSKVNTVFQLVLVAAALLQPEFGTEETLSYITYLSICEIYLHRQQTDGNHLQEENPVDLKISIISYGSNLKGEMRSLVPRQKKEIVKAISRALVGYSSELNCVTQPVEISVMSPGIGNSTCCCQIILEVHLMPVTKAVSLHFGAWPAGRITNYEMSLLKSLMQFSIRIIL